MNTVKFINGNGDIAILKVTQANHFNRRGGMTVAQANFAMCRKGFRRLRTKADRATFRGIWKAYQTQHKTLRPR